MWFAIAAPLPPLSELAQNRRAKQPVDIALDSVGGYLPLAHLHELVGEGTGVAQLKLGIARPRTGVALCVENPVFEAARKVGEAEPPDVPGNFRQRIN